MKKVYCIGELLIDFVAEKQGNDLSRAVIFTKKAGGAPANVACAIAKLGGHSVFVGSVGKDPFGHYLLDILISSGVDTGWVQRADTFTTLAFVSLSEDGERDFVFSRGADRELKYRPKLKNEFSGNMVHLGAATALLGGGLEEAYDRYFFDALTHEAFISFDPNYRSDLWAGKEREFVKKCQPFIEKAHLCKFSLEEARLLSGKEDLEACSKALHTKGTPLLAITLGSEGTYISSRDFSLQVPSIVVRPVDTTGAGDAFMGCLLKQIATLESPLGLPGMEEQLIRMVRKANIAGALTTTNYGAIESLPAEEQLNV